MKLGLDFYNREDVVQIARELLGKELVTNIDGDLTSGIITETEAYAGIIDKASHAYGGRNTNRTRIMFGPGGMAYVYLCYGIHHLFNVVTHSEGVPHAVLIRNIQPLKGLEVQLLRRGKQKLDKTFSTGPGTMSQALGIKTKHTALSLLGDTIWIEDIGIKIPKKDIKVTPRIGVD
ncbi:MAG TPA: DNA-3-methyladenine glycosylase, partial [Bacteroidia bacterium]|nr:DNA-3-methyladenine glycosylase [Bacteroidia bacterium]